MITMIGKQGKSKGSITLHSVHGILENRRKQKEPTYEQQIALEHAEKFKMTDKEQDSLRKKLADLGLLKDDTITKIIDIRPKSEALLKYILSSEKKTFSDDETKKVLAVVKEAA